MGEMEVAAPASSTPEAGSVDGSRAPRLSVTVLSYNYGHYLAGCLESILGQTFTDFEVIVIDDHSSDDTSEVAARFAADPRVRVVRHEQNLGFVASLIEGTEKLSRGPLVTVISADDLVLDRTAFQQQVAMFDRDPRLACCFTGYEYFDGDRPEGSKRGPVNQDHIYCSEEAFAMLMGCGPRRLHPIHSGTVIRAEAYRAAGGYRRDLRYAVDAVIWPMLALQGPVGYVGAPLYGYRVHAGQMSAGMAVQRRHIAEIQRGIDLACAMAESQGRDVSRIRDEARRFKIGDTGMGHAFAGQKVAALGCWLAAMSFNPVLAVRSRTLQSILPRVLLGERLTGRLQNRFRRVRPGIPAL